MADAVSESFGRLQAPSSRRRPVPTLTDLSMRATLANVNRIQDFTLIPEHLVVDLFTVRLSAQGAKLI